MARGDRSRRRRPGRGCVWLPGRDGLIFWPLGPQGRAARLATTGPAISMRLTIGTGRTPGQVPVRRSPQTAELVRGDCLARVRAPGCVPRSPKLRVQGRSSPVFLGPVALRAGAGPALAAPVRPYCLICKCSRARARCLAGSLPRLSCYISLIHPLPHPPHLLTARKMMKSASAVGSLAFICPAFSRART